MDARPLAGLRVLDVGTRISAPFCAGLLGEQGADVIKIEEPRGGDFMRTIGPYVDGYSLWWSVEGRGRGSTAWASHTAGCSTSPATATAHPSGPG